MDGGGPGWGLRALLGGAQGNRVWEAQVSAGTRRGCRERHQGLSVDEEVLQVFWKGQDGSSGRKQVAGQGEEAGWGDSGRTEPFVLRVTKGGGDTGWGKVTFQGFKEPGGFPVGQGPGLEGLEWVRQKLSGPREHWVLDSVPLWVPGGSTHDSQMGPLL